MKTVSLTGESRAEFVDYRGRERSSMFFRRGAGTEYIKAGSCFRRRRPDNVEETATVIGVSSDSFGIPHVRYRLEFMKPSSATRFVDGPRVLALATFAETYRDRVAS